ncbi:MAG TPA: hexose kinase [Anaerolineales bacterium]|nr:hexose kinase [Anaerolineales bacterium]
MIITLTPNTGIDHTLQVSKFQLDKTIRATDSAWGMGGKATDVSWILGRLEVPTRALGFATGPNGLRMESMLQQRGVETDFVWVEGETRLNSVIVVAGEAQSTITSSTLKVSTEHLSEFNSRYQEALKRASCVVMGGSLPMGVPMEFYGEAIDLAHGHGVPVIFDSSGAALLAGLQHHPRLVKPNLVELDDLLGYQPATQIEAAQAGRRLRREYGTDVIITLGEQGAIALFREGSYFVHPISIEVLSSAGAGDGVLAGMALAYSRRESPEYGLRHGFALAGAILKTLATADFQVEEYQELISQICITPLDN